MIGLIVLCLILVSGPVLLSVAAFCRFRGHRWLRYVTSFLGTCTSLFALDFLAVMLNLRHEWDSTPRGKFIYDITYWVHHTFTDPPESLVERTFRIADAWRWSYLYAPVMWASLVYALGVGVLRLSMRWSELRAAGASRSRSP
jgi:hypothetical protein